MLEDRGISRERILSPARAIECALKALRGRKRQDDPGDERDRPQGHRHQARGMQRDQDPECCDEGKHDDAQEACMPAEGVRAFRPHEEMIDLGLPRAGGEDTMRFEP